MNQNYGGYGGGGATMNTGMFPDQSMMRTPEYQQRMRPPYMPVIIYYYHFLIYQYNY